MRHDDRQGSLFVGNRRGRRRGYGIDLNGGAYVTVTGNVFNYNRHAVASTGMGNSGYVARFNYVLQGGFREGGSWYSDGYYNQHFDVHGEHGGYGGPAGTYFEIAFNTIRGEQSYYVTQTRPALMLRGIPAVGVDLQNRSQFNVVRWPSG